MESAAARTATPYPRWRIRIDSQALAIWALAGGLVLYLGLDGGGYYLVVRSQIGIVVWWLVLLGAAWGLLPAMRLTRVAWIAVGLFAALLVWSAIASSWSLSSERSLGEVSRLASYLGVLLLALGIHNDRETAVRHTVAAIASAVTLVAAFALLSRLRPELFPAAQTTASFLPGAHGRLAWPLNYWNALAALVAVGLPLLLAVATSARTLAVQALAAGAIPLTVLCGYLSFSRGGAIAGTAAVVVFIALAPERFVKLATLALSVLGSGVLIAAAGHRHAIEQGLTNGAARHEGTTLLVAVLLVCVGVGVAQAGIGLAARHGTLPRPLRVSPGRARVLLAAVLAAGLIAALLAGAPTRLSHAWRDFKHPNYSALHQNAIGRFGVASGNGRYAYWSAAVASTKGHLLKGSGPGTFELLWLPRASYYSYVRNAHSLYIETLAEVGLVGLVLLVGMLSAILGAGVRLATRAGALLRTQAAGVVAACVAFLVSAAFDWVWQVPVLPAALLLLAASVLAPSRANPRATGASLPTGSPRPVAASRRSGASPRAWLLRGAVVLTAVASLIAIGVPLATTNAVRASQAAAATGHTAAALSSARTAASLEPGATSPQLQLALVLELRGDYHSALVAAQRASMNEPQNWQPWLVISRLESEAGDARAAVAAFRRAHALNPQSPLLHR